MISRFSLLPSILFMASIILSSTIALADDDDEKKRETLRVCADPNYMPFSHTDKTGYENQIAALIGKELNIPVAYTWFPQRMGFIRNTLKKKDDISGEYPCDLVMGVPKEFDFAKATIPYMRSTYALVMLKDGKLKELKQGNDFVKLPAGILQDMKVGVTERSPGALWLSKYALYKQMSPYIAQSGDPDEFPSEPMYNDLIAGKLDAAVVWGPTAAYFSRLSPDKIKVLHLNTMPGVRFDFSISTAVRYGDDKWKSQVETILKNKSAAINEILTKAGILLLENTYTPEKDDDDDDDDKGKKPKISAPAPKAPEVVVAKAMAPVAPKAPVAPVTVVSTKTKTVVKTTTVQSDGTVTKTKTTTKTKTSTKGAFDPKDPYSSHVKCKEGKKCKIDKFLLKGFRAFSQCQVCHGIDGNGSTIAPSLLGKLKKEVTYDLFLDRVSNGFKGQIGVMPPWKSNPNIMKNITNLYAYLKARSDGVIPAGRLKKFKH